MVEYLKYDYIHTNKENIQIISGAQQGIDIVCKGLINYSDVVFIEEPTKMEQYKFLRAEELK